MAEVLGITEQALCRWEMRHAEASCERMKQGRPEVIPEKEKHRIRECYLKHYRQWGPRVLALWAEREGLGKWSPSTVTQVIRDLREKLEEPAKPERYDVTAPGVMWSEDGAGFKERGRKKELLVVQDECSRFKINHRLVAGPAQTEDVVEYLREAFTTHEPPLVLKHDGDSVFQSERVKDLLDEYGVVDLKGPPYYPEYNGKKERSIRDIKSYERAMRRHGVGGSLQKRLDETISDLNDHRPRPVLGGRTAREVFESDRGRLPDRWRFRREVRRKELQLRREAKSRKELTSAHRRAVEEVLSAYRLVEKTVDVSTNLLRKSVTN